MPLHRGVGEDSWECLELNGNQTSQSWRKSVLNIHCKDWCGSWNSNTLAICCEELTHLKRPWCWERLKVEGEGNDQGWDGCMASLTRWTWVWVGVGQGSLMCCSPWGRKESDMIEWLNWTELSWKIVCSYSLQFLGSDEVIIERYLLYNTVYIHMFSNIHDMAKTF